MPVTSHEIAWWRVFLAGQCGPELTGMAPCFAGEKKVRKQGWETEAEREGEASHIELY